MKYLRKVETANDIHRVAILPPNLVLINETKKVMYNVFVPGVYIQHIDGGLFTTEEWTQLGYPNDEANGVAVISDACRFVIDKTSLSRKAWSSDTSNAVEGVMLTSDYATAKTDYAGEANTALIAVDDTGGAALACANHKFPNGAKGYLPALGEWRAAYAYKTDIDAAMTLIGGTALAPTYHWTSTQYRMSSAWCISWDNGFVSEVEKNSGNKQVVRAFQLYNPLSL